MSQLGSIMNTDQVRGKPGRPRAISESLIPKVISWHRSGLGYRAIARELARQGLWVDWSTVRRVIKAYQDSARENMAPRHF
jgi:transposase-like protein